MTAAHAALLVLGCGSQAPGTLDAPPAHDAGDEADAPPPGPTACPAGPAGLDCLFAQWDRLQLGCDGELLDAFRASVAARHGDLPAWHQGRALFVSWDRSVGVAGAWNGWDPARLVTEPVCSSELFAAEAPVPSGRHPYKVVVDGTWRLDPESFAFAYDDFSGNADGRNSVLNTYDSGLGHLVMPDEELCSEALGNCRPFTTYLPPGYGAPDNAGRRYPALFLHDGQNVFDDHDCCFGHTGWEVNVTLDEEIAAGRVEPLVVVGFDHAGAQRADEYAFALRDAFVDFQVNVVQRRASETWRLDPERIYTAGSSLGGHISLVLAFTHPDVYAGAASLSGALWPNEGTEASVFSLVQQRGRLPLRLYLDHGGTEGDGTDSYADNVAMRDLLAALGWPRHDAPSCPPEGDVLCYLHAAGATHDELAWKDRAHLFLRFLFPARE